MVNFIVPRNWICGVQINYQPSLMSGAMEPHPSEADNMSKEVIEGVRMRVNYGETDEYKQAGDRYRGFDAARYATCIGSTLQQTDTSCCECLCTSTGIQSLLASDHGIANLICITVLVFSKPDDSCMHLAVFCVEDESPLCCHCNTSRLAQCALQWYNGTSICAFQCCTTQSYIC